MAYNPLNIAAAASNQTATSGTVVFSNANNITFGMSNSSAVTASYSQSNQQISAFAVSNTITNGATTSGTLNASALSFRGVGNASVGISNGSVVISASSGGGGISNINLSAGTTSTNASAFTFASSNGVSFGLGSGASSGVITASVATNYQSSNANYLTSQSNQAISAANGSSTFQTASFANSNGVSFSTGTQGLYATVQTNYLTTAMASNASSNFAGTNGAITGGSITVNTSGVSVNLPAYLTTARASTDAIGLNTAQTNVTWTANSSGLSLNAAGYAGTGTTFNGANISGSITNDSNGLNLSLSAAAPGGGGGVALFDGANSITSGTASFDPGGGVSFGINGQTITASAPAAAGKTFSYWENLAPSPVSSAASSVVGASFGTVIVQPLSPYEGYQFGGNMTVNTMLLDFFASATSSSHSLSVDVGFYTMVNSTQLSIVNSVASTWALAANSNNSRTYNGTRFLSFHSSQWSSTPVFSEDVLYWWGVVLRSSNYAPTMSHIGQWLGASTIRSGTFGVSASTGNVSMHQAPFLGILGTTQTVIPASIAMSQVEFSTPLAGFMPHLVFNNIMSSF